MKITKYALRYIENELYLDKYDCETIYIDKAMLFDTWESAYNYRNNIDVAYLYEIIEFEVNYKMIRKY